MSAPWATACDLLKILRQDWTTAAELAEERQYKKADLLYPWLAEWSAQGLLEVRQIKKARNGRLVKEYILSPYWKSGSAP